MEFLELLGGVGIVILLLALPFFPLLIMELVNNYEKYDGDWIGFITFITVPLAATLYIYIGTCPPAWLVELFTINC